jgi:hypothetical protein
LVDSSVWIDFLQTTRSESQDYLSNLIQVPGVVGVPGPVIQEVLQGIRDDEQFRLTRERLCRFPIIHPDTDTYVMAARLYRTVARKGMVVPPGDLTIAALAIQHACELYTLDVRHFERIEKHSELRLHRFPRTTPR